MKTYEEELVTKDEFIEKLEYALNHGGITISYHLPESYINGNKTVNNAKIGDFQFSQIHTNKQAMFNPENDLTDYLVISEKGEEVTFKITQDEGNKIWKDLYETWNARMKRSDFIEATSKRICDEDRTYTQEQ